MDTEKTSLRQSIENFYLPRQLIEAIHDLGAIPQGSREDVVGVGFVDIVGYSELSQLLSPKENQDILNGLYSAFNRVLQRHGGFLNKIEGDSLMFHFGGTTDREVRGLEREEKIKVITRKLFYTSVEMQRICSLFNKTRPFLRDEADAATRESVEKAYGILRSLRGQDTVGEAFNAFFQLRIRAGANVGDVIVGNFGPEGAKRWDVIGHPVVKARRMEASAPAGGLRISEDFFRLLEKTGIADAYAQRFRREAAAMDSRYRRISYEELFHYSEVVLREKQGASFDSYSVQVNPSLPEELVEQAELLLRKGLAGVKALVKLIEYYRGNRYVMNGLEEFLTGKGVNIPWETLDELLGAGLRELGLDPGRHSSDRQGEALFSYMRELGRIQDTVKEEYPHGDLGDSVLRAGRDAGFEEQFAAVSRAYRRRYKEMRRAVVRRTYFYNILYPLVWRAFQVSLLEYQNRFAELQEF